MAPEGSNHELLTSQLAGRWVDGPEGRMGGGCGAVAVECSGVADTGLCFAACRPAVVALFLDSCQ